MEENEVPSPLSYKKVHLTGRPMAGKAEEDGIFPSLYHLPPNVLTTSPGWSKNSARATKTGEGKSSPAKG